MALLAATTNYEEKQPRNPAKQLFKLERVERLFRAAGSPHDAARIVHIAGSKGKGSVARTVAHVLARRPGAAPVGLYTSPHLQDLGERVMVGAAPASDEMLAKAADGLLPYLREVHGTAQQPTFFELFTAIAWIVFREAGAKDVVLETGLGGRLDATNVCCPAVTVITTIELEHTRLLGDTIDAIAREKAGIIKPGVPVVTTARGTALEVIRRTAREQDAPLTVIGEDVRVDDIRVGPGPVTQFTLRAGDETLALRVPVPGIHHAENAAAAYAALASLGLYEGWAQALSTAQLPGVLEPVAHDPLVLIDGAHTPRSAAATRAALAAAWPERPFGVLFALLDEKDVDAIADVLVPGADFVVTCRVDSPRALDAETLATAVRRRTTAPVVSRATPAEGLGAARELAAEDTLILTVGSVYLAGAVRDAVGLRPGARLDPSDYFSSSKDSRMRR